MTNQNQSLRPCKPRATAAKAATAVPVADQLPTTTAVTPPDGTPDPEPAKPISKQAQLAALVTRDAGATLDQMIDLTGWLPHTTRAAMTGLKKKGYAISSDRIDGVRTYRAVAPEVA